MKKRGLPLRRSVVHTAHLSLRIEPELKQKIKELHDSGIDAPEFLRDRIRAAVREATDQAQKPDQAA